MNHIDTIVIGGGQAGLAMSASLGARGVEHLVLERGRIGERWRSERWDSLQLLTPNWMTRLPGSAEPSDDPNGFMSKDDLIRFLEDYASMVGVPVREGVTVTSVRSDLHGFIIETTEGTFTSRNVVVATGQCGRPAIPSMASRLDAAIEQIHAAHYRNPDLLASGGVLVVGTGASGIQIAAELAGAGRQVILATGRHARAVRRYRGRDIWWWLDRTGSLAQTADDVRDLDAARRTPSLGLTGSQGGIDIDLGSLQRTGVRIAGRVADVDGPTVVFGDNAARDAADADDRLVRLLGKFDKWAVAHGFDADLDAPVRPLPVRVAAPLEGEFDLAAAGVRTVIWSTGYRQFYPWLGVPVLDNNGEIIHHRGLTPVPGLHVLGLRFQWRRDSHFLAGVGRDAEFLAGHIAARSSAAAVA